MNDQQLRSMSEQAIRERFRCAPAYYLQAKLERKRALARRDRRRAGRAAARSHPGRRKDDTREPSARQDPPANAVSLVAAPADAPVPVPPPEEPFVPEPHLFEAPLQAPVESDPEPDPQAEIDTWFTAEARSESLDLALPGFEILDAALAEFDQPREEPETRIDLELEFTQQAILEAALEDYGNWPFLSDSGPEQEPEPEAAEDLDLELESQRADAPAEDSELELLLQQVLESEPELNLVLDADPELEEALASEERAARAVSNVTRGDFGNQDAPTIRVVSVAMDRKRPNMVRVVRDSSRLAV